MGKVIRFPSNDKASPVQETALPPLLDERQMQMEKVLRAVAAALRRGTIRPEQMFVLFSQGDTYSYLNLDYPPDELVKAVGLVVQDIARGYDSD